MLPPIGIFELGLVIVVAIVFIKPDDWPKFLRKIGRLYGQLHEYMYKLKAYGRDTYNQITNLDTPDYEEVDDRNLVEEGDKDEDVDEEEEDEWERQTERYEIAQKWRRGKARQHRSAQRPRRRRSH